MSAPGRYPSRLFIAPVTTRIRRIPTEVALDKKVGIPKASVVNLDTLATIPKRTLAERISQLPEAKMRDVDDALKFALGLT